MIKAVIIGCILIGTNVWAETQSQPDNTNKVKGSEKVDQMLTSNSLRAFSGSKSRWSIASVWNYNGGNIPSPFAQNRPNIAGAAATTAKTDVDASLNGKYNWDVKHAILAGFGLRYISPFNSTPGSDYSGKRFDVLNPCFIFQYLYDFAGVQAVLQTKVLQWTQTDQTANGYAQQYSFDQESMYPIKGTGLSLALSTIFNLNTFDKNDDALKGAQSQYQVQIAPYLEFKLNDVFNLKTMLNLFFYDNYRSDSKWNRETVIQSLGVGIAFTRDIFLYPSVSFVPADLSAKLTNVSVQLTLNLF